MKKIVKLFGAVIVILSCVCMFAACGGGGLKTAKWDGYNGMAFAKYLEQGVKAMEPDAKITVTYEEGWQKAEKIDTRDLHGGTAVTYTAALYSNGDAWEYRFFMEWDKKTNMLTVRGANSEELGWVTNVTAIEAESMLEMLEKYIN